MSSYFDKMLSVRRHCAAVQEVMWGLFFFLMQSFPDFQSASSQGAEIRTAAVTSFLEEGFTLCGNLL